jgi:hypothetical protein
MFSFFPVFFRRSPFRYFDLLRFPTFFLRFPSNRETTDVTFSKTKNDVYNTIGVLVFMWTHYYVFSRDVPSPRPNRDSRSRARSGSVTLGLGQSRSRSVSVSVCLGLGQSRSRYVSVSVSLGLGRSRSKSRSISVLINPDPDLS